MQYDIEFESPIPGTDDTRTRNAVVEVIGRWTRPTYWEPGESPEVHVLYVDGDPEARLTATEFADIEEMALAEHRLEER